MQITATGLGKRFQRDWIFRGLTRVFRPGSATAVLGPNGAGKSTLLNTFSGQLLPTEGTLAYSLAGQDLAVEDVPRHLAYAAPYLELLEELTLLEMLQFHTQFKPLRPGVTLDQLIGIMYLEKARHQLVREFSSGMKQRLKLGLALYADAPLLLLDEPTTNLDTTGVAWYQEHVQATRAGRTLLLSSNVPAEYGFCDEQLVVTDFQLVRG
ncbi:ABC transporter ATP-binding protein [Hymenobacter negativus]|uniref:ATP-binding cassette domain-containing protein n=1 Tax=Hymenobacter negativus TaxID=2795026 RepID=A0ABS0Q3G4_9BACT|nr:MULTISPECIES: ATP-binding cassette domain-containing protein [Bacteria]MBH8557173.1 ATP-binding cassette domain-containing protein [Hymenobacter negativus]MBH8569465.1 ATP-binding cassette domain-containing protein [Hymenobacter negativus]MBR7209201.1 ATP-binding cassette domain-containing protein [Microvirga sp. STS02]